MHLIDASAAVSQSESGSCRLWIHSGLAPSSNLQLRAVGLQNLIGTRERLESRVSHRKHSAGCTSNRYSSRFRCAQYFPSRLQLQASSFQNLPETAKRVETRVSYTKQKTGYTSTRDSSHHRGAEYSPPNLQPLASNLQNHSPRVRCLAPHANGNFPLHSRRVWPKIGSQSRTGKGRLKKFVNR